VVLASAVRRSVRGGQWSRKQVLVVVHPLNTAMIGVTTALVCVVYTTSLVVRRLSLFTSAHFWTWKTANACVTATAILYIISHMLVLFERHLAGSRPLLHGQLVTRSTVLLGVSALWIYSILVACTPVLRCLVDPHCGHLKQEAAGFRRGYVAYLVIQFTCGAVASILLIVSVVDRLWRGRHASSNALDISRRPPTDINVDEQQARRCIVALLVCAACWTPCVTFQLVDQLGCGLSSHHLDRKLIISIVIRQVSPLVGLSTGAILPLIYSCRRPPRPGCRITAFNTS